MGPSKSIRAAIAEHGAMTPAQAAAVLGMTASTVATFMRNMSYKGILAAQDGVYAIGRELVQPKRRYDPATVEYNRKARKRRYAAKQRALLPPKPPKVSKSKRTPEEQAERIRLHNLERGRIANAKVAAKRAAERDTKAALRLLVRDCAKSEPKVAPKPSQSVDEFMANGGRVEILPGFAYVMPSHMPVGARYGVAG